MKSNAVYRPGERIANRFLVHAVRRGGMGEVYLCLDEQTKLPLALKTIKTEHGSSPAARALFEQEVGTWVSLGRHANIVRCYHLERLDNRDFMVLEWISGEPDRGVGLDEWLARRGKPELRTALDFAVDIARGLAFAQERVPGLVHRDLKPANVLVAQGPVAKVTDFGLARLADADMGGTDEVGERAAVGLDSPTPASTRWWQRLWSRRAQPTPALDSPMPVASVHQTRVAGTPPYMAPEQWLGQRLDARTDIYAFGCILHELLTGLRPYEAATLERLRALHLEAPVPQARELREVPVAVGSIVERCLQKDPQARYPTLAALLDDLDGAYRKLFPQGPRPAPVPEELTAGDYNNRGLTYNTLKRYDEAIADYARAIELDPTDAKAFNNRGNAHKSLRRYDEALADFNQAIEFAPTFATIFNNRGNTYDALQRYEMALADYTRAIELDPTLAIAFNNRGNTYGTLQRHEEALADCTRAIKLDPTLAIAFHNRGHTYATLQRYDEALADYDRAIDLDPTEAKAFTNRSNTYHTLQRYDEALADCNHAIELDPSYATAFNNRGLTYHTLKRYGEIGRAHV